MKRVLSAAVLALVVTATFAAAQVQDAVIAEVPFSFLVGKMTLPAGTYKISATANLDEIRISQVGGKSSAVVPVVTRLSPRPGEESSVVFDVEGTNHYLSEIYMPGLDGFQVPGATVKHTHMSIKGRK